MYVRKCYVKRIERVCRRAGWLSNRFAFLFLFSLLQSVFFPGSISSFYYYLLWKIHCKRNITFNGIHFTLNIVSKLIRFLSHLSLFLHFYYSYGNMYVLFYIFLLFLLLLITFEYNIKTVLYLALPNTYYTHTHSTHIWITRIIIEKYSYIICILLIIKMVLHWVHYIKLCNISRKSYLQREKEIDI